MTSMTNDKNEPSTETWMERARAEGSVAVETGGRTVARSLQASGGWDPYEVWLRRIDWPRRRRIDPSTPAGR